MSVQRPRDTINGAIISCNWLPGYFATSPQQSVALRSSLLCHISCPHLHQRPRSIRNTQKRQ